MTRIRCYPGNCVLHAVHVVLGLLLLLTVAPPLVPTMQAQAPQDTSLAGDCDLGVIRSSHNGVLTQATVPMSPGVLFSDSGNFQEHGVDQPCDAEKQLGPFEVTAGGRLRLQITGSPPAPATWSLYNSGTGVSISYEPLIGREYASGSTVLAAGIPAEKTEVSAEGTWPGPGRLRATIGAPRGAGPLSGSCFGQGYTAQVDIVEVFAEGYAAPGMALHAGDRLTTDTFGEVLATPAHLLIGRDSDILIQAAPQTREGTFDIPTGELPDYWTTPEPPEYVLELSAAIREFEQGGYVLPLNTNWPDYNSWTLEEAYRRLQFTENPCIAAVELKLYLDSTQGEWTELTLAKLAVDTAFIWLLPNNWDIIDGLGKWLFGKVPLVGSASTAENVLSTYDRWKKEWVGTVAAQRAKWALAAFDQSRDGRWTAQEIEANMRLLQQQSEQLKAEIEKMGPLFEAEVQRRTQAAEQEIAALKKASAVRLKQIAEETQVAYQALQQKLATMPEAKDDGREIADRKSPKQLLEEEFWQKYMGRNATEELGTAASIKAVEAKNALELQGLANAYEREVSERLTRIAELQTHRDTWETYSLPVVKNDCARLKELATKEKLQRCAPTVIKVFGGGVRVVDNPRAPGGKSVSVEVNGFLVKPDGTEYAVENRGETAVVRVYEGRVRIIAPDGRQMGLSAGQEVTLPEAAVATFDLTTDTGGLVSGIPLRNIPLDDDVPQPYGTVRFESTDGALPEGWIWQETAANHYQAGNATLDMPEPDVVQVTAPDDNDFWSLRDDAPRLLHKVTGDFDLEGEMLLECAGLDFASSEFILFAPGSSLGELKGQFYPGDSKSQYLIVGGGWRHGEVLNKLPIVNRRFQDGPDAPAVPVRFKMSRRGAVLKTHWSTDGGQTWTLSGRDDIVLPETMWAGWVFKRMAYDRLVEEPAVTTLRDIRLASAPLGTLPDDEWDVVDFTGDVVPLNTALVMAHDGTQPGYVQVYSPWVLPGDFDLIVRFDAPPIDSRADQERYLHVAVSSNTEQNHVYLRNLLTADGHRYTADLGINNTWFRGHRADTQDHSGYLRLVRQGGVFSGYYWKDNDWVLLADWQEGFSDPVYLDLRYGWTSPFPAPQTVRFTIEQLVTPDGVLFGSGASVQPVRQPTAESAQPTAEPTTAPPTQPAETAVPAGIAAFAVSPDVVAPGEWVTLSWQTSGGVPYVFHVLDAAGHTAQLHQATLEPVGALDVPVLLDSGDTIHFALGLYSPARNEWIASATVTVKVSAAARPPTVEPAGAGWAGAWDTNWGVVMLQVSGNQVTGDYPHDDGRLQGTISPDGMTLEGMWSEAPSYQGPNDAGRFVFTLAPDGLSWTGSWGYGDGLDAGTWGATRTHP